MSPESGAEQASVIISHCGQYSMYMNKVYTSHLIVSTRMVANISNTANKVKKQRISVIKLSNYDHEYLEKV